MPFVQIDIQEAIRIDSAIPPNGGAQIDSMDGGVQTLFHNDGRVQSSLYLNHLLSNKSLNPEYQKSLFF